MPPRIAQQGGGASQPTDDRITRLMADIRSLGRLPLLRRGTDAAATAERNLAKRLGKAREAGHLTAEHEAVLTALDDPGDAPDDAPPLAHASTECLMQEIRAFGRVPQLKRGTDAAATAERSLAKRLGKAREAGHLTAEHEAVLTALDDPGDAPDDAPPLALASTECLMQEIRAWTSSPI